MKKRGLIFILFLILIFSFKEDVDAFSKQYPYNYEVNMVVKSNGKIGLRGWGILNAGTGLSSGSSFHDSPRLNVNLGSGGSGKLCTRTNNSYIYTLYVMPLNRNGKIPTKSDGSYDISKLMQIGEMYGSGTDITPVMCHHTNTEPCSNFQSQNACYNNVGWSFVFDESIVNQAQFNYGYVFFMKITASLSGINYTFPMGIYQERVSGFGNEKVHYVNDIYNDDIMRVSVIANDGYYQNCSVSLGKCGGDLTQYVKRRKFATGAVLPVTNFVKNQNQNFLYGIVFYQVNTDIASGVWIPATWVAPARITYFIPDNPIEEPVDAKTCSPKSTTQKTQNPSIKACSGNTSFSPGDNLTNCSVDTYTFYTQTCKETYDNANSNLSINTPTKRGGGITASASFKTKYTCTYNFNTTLFMENYNNAIKNLKIYEELGDTANLYATKNIISSLKENLNNYVKLTTNTTNWNSGYSFSDLEATLKVIYDTGKTVSKNLVADSNGYLHTKTDLTGDGVKEANYCKVDASQSVTVDGVKYTVNNVSCGEEWSVNLSLPKTCISMKTGEMESCKNDNTQLDGGNKYYIDFNENSGNVTLTVKNLGRDKKWSISLTSCPFSIKEKLIEQRIIFRQIELDDPFLQSYNITSNTREIGKNYLNSKYNFINIIKTDIWSKDYFYRFSMSKNNVHKIKKDTNDQVSKYLGDKCYLTSNNQYVCDFIRNKNNIGSNSFFTKIESN